MTNHQKKNKLHKYHTHNEYLIKLLSNGELWFQNPTKFNDPYDCHVVYRDDYTLGDITRFLESAQMIGANTSTLTDKVLRSNVAELWVKDQHLIKKVVLESLEKQIKAVGVSCFSKKEDSMLMWSHYANSHQGVCLTFDENKLRENFHSIQCVKYDPIFPVLDLSDAFAPNTIICQKSPEWCYEGEVRIIEFKEGSYPFEKSSLLAITFGLRMPEHEKQLILKTVRANNYINVEFRQVVIKNNAYKIEFAPCT